ncbi:MAG: hypothetical protein QGF21_11170 [Vicinamibacterales bacterium]|jgi:hypothetical protein|nr:hypothetical protein [Acidobacteriota bacterium]MDP7471154.1 hypothetical protein [Vicinamibacterales bacterium]MDP7672490.1 hypothetical protein [Vicinamibacterales bacterium]HJO37061.1 hypothetical protein [Vicinamibacterales bacterium]
MKTFLTGIAIASVASAASAQPLTLDELLFRANQSVIAYEQVFSNAVTEESYEQRIVRFDGSPRGERQLRSDMLFIQLPGAVSWLGFRDVFEVDGEPVRDRDARLQELFLGDARPAVEQATTIALESARYNIGDLVRTVNLPTIALAFLHPLNQHRFDFEHLGEVTVDGRSAWIVGYSEQTRPTFVQSRGGDTFARGRFWLDVQTGQTLRSELILGTSRSEILTTITVDYRKDAALTLWVPESMHEVYERPRRSRADRIEATATYSNFRQFGVQTEESVRVPR